MTRARRSAAILALSATAAVFPHPAYAAPPLAVANVWIASWSGGWARICGHGDVNDGATTVARWVFTVTGAVAEPFPVGPYVQIEDGDTFDYCNTWWVGSPPDAAFTVTLTFTGLRADTAVANTDLGGGAVLVYEWNSVVGDDNQVQFGSTG